MAKFSFRLEGYLNVKEKIEEQKRLEYGKAVKRLEDEKDKKRRMELELAQGTNELRGKIDYGISPDEFIRFKQYLVHLEKMIIRQENEIKRAAEYAESKRIELVAAMKQRKMVDVLKEHDYEEYLDEEKRNEQRIVDEIVSFRYGNSEE